MKKLDVTQQPVIYADNKTALMMYSGHVGRILSNVSIAMLVLSLASVWSVIFTVLALVLLIALIILLFCGMVVSVGAVTAVPGYMGLFKWALGSMSNSNSAVETVFGTIIKAWPIITPIAIGAAALSIVFFALDKTQKHRRRIIISISVLALALVALIVLLVGGAAA